MINELKKCFLKKTLTSEFASLALLIAEKQINKKKNIPKEIRNDALSDFSIKLVKKWEKINPDKFPASYINLMALTSLIDIQRKFKYRIDKIEHIKIFEEEKTEEFNSWCSKKIVLNKLNKEQKSNARKFVMKEFRKGKSKRLISRETKINQKTIIKWIKLYDKYGSKFYKLDLRKNNQRPKFN